MTLNSRTQNKHTALLEFCRYHDDSGRQRVLSNGSIMSNESEDLLSPPMSPVGGSILFPDDKLEPNSPSDAAGEA